VRITAGRSAPPHAVAPAETRRARSLTPAEVAWIALVPCAIVSLAAIVVLGPPVGHALFEPGSEPLWPPGWWETQGRPEPVKFGRYVLAVLAPLLLVGVVLAGARRPPALRARTIVAATLTSQALLVAFVVFAALGQHRVIFDERPLPPIFDVRTLAIAAAMLLVALIALRRERIAATIARLARETATWRAIGLLVAAMVAAMWLVEGVSSDRVREDTGAFNWTLNDTFAVLNGRTPLVDYHIIYAKLLPYPTALVISAFGETGLVYTITTMVLSVLALLGVYAIFRYVVGSSLLALGLFVPFVATSAIDHPMAYIAMFPMRYGGAYLLAWLTARHIAGRSPRHAWVLFLVGGIVTVDMQEFGVAAVVAIVVALLCAAPPRSTAAVLRLGGSVAGGLLGAVALISAFTLVRAGSLPDPALLTEWPRIFTKLGWFSLPMPTVSLHLALYATFAGAIAVAVVRLLRSREDVLLTSMLAWSGTFGLLAGSYYIGRSDDLKLVSLFSAWSFALGLLTIVTVRALRAQGWRRPALAHLLVLLGFALSICSIGRFSPREQIAHLTEPQAPFVYRATAKRFVGERTRSGETVAILLPEGYRIAHELGLRNVAPYGIQNEIVTRAQLDELIDTARRERVDKIFVPMPGAFLAWEGDTAPEQLEVLAREGYPARSWEPGFVELRDDRARG
jgi:hypothetical protein